MRVSIFGLGYVGCVSAACFAKDGHEVIGVDVNPDKAALLNSGRSPIIEPGLAELIAKVVHSGRLRATINSEEAVRETALSFICVGTPSAESGALDLQYVRRVCEQIGETLRQKEERHTVVLRSTMLPGSTDGTVVPILEKTSDKSAGRDFDVCFNPEFLREGSALRDFYDPPRTVIGELHPAGGDLLASLYKGLSAPLIRTDLRAAEMVKYADNAFHGLKVAFGNEIGNLCKAMGIDGHKVMDIFVLDTKLNLSPVYLKPGFAFGGSCLPKDLRAIVRRATEINVDTPLLRAVLKSNEYQKRRGYELIRRTRRKKIGVLGLSFKADTDDLRESPAVELVETLHGKGYDVVVYDQNVSLSALMGSNLAYIQRELPHLSNMLRQSLDEVLEHAEVLVITNRDPEFAGILEKLRPNQRVLDFARIVSPEGVSRKDCYEGICW
jgi:GDP-mannose 6-dehydrogenase